MIFVVYVCVPMYLSARVRAFRCERGVEEHRIVVKRGKENVRVIVPIIEKNI